jgi:hypothetical protein
MFVVQAGVGEALELGVDVGAVGDGGDAEQAMEVGGGFDGELVGEDVAHLVGDDAGDLVLAVGAGDELAGEVDAASCEREAVDVGGLDQSEVELEVGGREGGEETRADGVEVGVQGRVLDGAIVAINLIGHGFAEPLFLLLGEDVGLGGLEDGGRFAAGRWGLLCKRERAKADEEKRQGAGGEIARAHEGPVIREWRPS